MLAVLYLVFNEGYAATAGETHVRHDLCREAIRLAKLLCVLMPDEPEAFGLLALMLFHDSRRDARVTRGGRARAARRPGPRRCGTRPRSTRGGACSAARSRCGGPGPYQVQAAIAELHTHDDTDWAQIVAALRPPARGRPVTGRSSSTARWRSRSPTALEHGLELLDAISGLDDYHLFHAARADLLRRLERHADAARAYETALALTTNEAERRFLTRRLREVGAEA